jgi:hypothetical protein
MTFIRRALQHPVSVQALIEFTLWLLLPYLAFGFFWAVVHGDKLGELQAQWNSVLPAGGDVAAFGEAAALWPAVLLLPSTCGVPGQ